MTLTSASLYSGIGGSDLGLQWAGFTPAWTAECDPYRRTVLSERWPEARHHWSAEEAVSLVQPSPTLLWADLTALDRWPLIFAAMQLFAPAWTVIEAAPAVFLEPMFRDLARHGDWGFMPLYVQVHTTVPGLAADWEDHRLRLLLVVTSDGRRHRDLGLTSPQLSIDVTAQAPAPDATRIEWLELSRGLPVGWTCVCGARPCRCDARARVQAIAECTPPMITQWLGGLVAQAEATRGRVAV